MKKDGTMNVFQKLQLARVQLQSKNLKKSGANKFAGYNYYELSDFLPTVNAIFAELELCGVVRYTADMATLTIYDSESPDKAIEFSSPMSTAALKGCHEVQNLGAVQTYIRRYLYTAALEIVEADALDATQGKESPTKDRQCQFELDAKIVTAFEKCTTMDELKVCWDAVPVGLRKAYANVKEEAKYRIGGQSA